MNDLTVTSSSITGKVKVAYLSKSSLVENCTFTYNKYLQRNQHFFLVIYIVWKVCKHKSINIFFSKQHYTVGQMFYRFRETKVLNMKSFQKVLGLLFKCSFNWDSLFLMHVTVNIWMRWKPQRGISLSREKAVFRNLLLKTIQVYKKAWRSYVPT